MQLKRGSTFPFNSQPYTLSIYTKFSRFINTLAAFRWTGHRYKYYILQNLIDYHKNTLQKQNQIYAFSITTSIAALKDIFIGQEKSTVEYRYLIQPPISDLIKQADDLYATHKYIEVYELLNKLKITKEKFCSNPEVLWRMSRVLFVMSHNEAVRQPIHKEMIDEAFQLISTALATEDNNPNVHKWMAILLDRSAGTDSTYRRTKVLSDVKKHLLRATDLDPTDTATLYMLGHWCYQLANLTWFQRKLASILFVSPPLASYEEAYNYFLKAEQLNPRIFIGNTYMLGKVCYHMKQWYRAKYYLDVAASLPCKTNIEKEYSQEAKRLAKELNYYDLSKRALFYKG